MSRNYGLSPIDGDSPWTIIDEPLISGNVVTGRVVDVQQQSVFQTTAGKVIALVLDGQPWQFGHQVLKTTVFVEPARTYANSFDANGQRGIVFYGDINAAVRPGHLIQSTVRRRGGQLYVKKLNNLTTNSRVSARFQIGGWMTALVALVTIGILLLFITAVLKAIVDGSLASAIVGLFLTLFEMLGPVVIMCVGVYWLIKSLFR
ncbi:hypothetical protein [Gordonibacter sp.]|uniref:hypothetical protein n=1 Tax=Gordonibacter sp. TaxID=1968902 RepID=UPI001FA47972|nr:hypothetical protein [Gordonibacter sp.]HIW75919.1 hypothetical protein [Candidatus Gordonibacter avicola]